MELNLQQQIFDQFSKANKVLVTLPVHLNADNISAALALSHFLKKMGKEADVVAPHPVPAELQFLPGADVIKVGLSDSKSLVLVVDTSIRELDEISYQTSDHKVSIFLRGKNEAFTPEDVAFTTDRSHYDLVVMVNAKSLEDLGGLLEQNADLFFDTPKINMDNHPGNEFFAPINFVDISASSIGEMLATLLMAYEEHLIDEDIATCLLTGIITKTNSFQQPQTTPKAFLKAAELISLGGRQQEVVKFLYKTKSLPLLRLWGRALARLKIENESRVVYSMLNLSDFGKAGASDSDLNAVLKELLDNISNFRVVALLTEVMGGGVRLLGAFHPQLNAQKLLHDLGAKESQSPYQLGTFAVHDVVLANIPLPEAEQEFLKALALVQPAAGGQVPTAV